MKNFKKTMRLFGLGLIIVLASLGIGVGGAVPIVPDKKREAMKEVKTELVEVSEGREKA